MTARCDKRISRPIESPSVGTFGPFTTAMVGACSELSPECVQLKGIQLKLIPKDWKQHQHYSKRTPPWIKLHRDLLNDYDYAHLPIEAKAIAPLMWLLASESKDGVIELASDALAFRLHIASDVLATGLKALIDKGFFIDASNVLSECYQDASPETETETETEIETKTETEVDNLLSIPLPSNAQELEKLSTGIKKPNLEWAHRLKEKELSGGVVTMAQKRMWREALHEKLS